MWNIVVKYNNESNKVAKLYNVSGAEEHKTRKVKNKTKKKMVEADMEIATLNKQKAVGRVG